VRTDGSRATDYAQSLHHALAGAGHGRPPGTLAYASWGQGVESEVAPNRARYTNAGQACRR
jgi:iron complex outermembrane recepter protein